jgi:hypothetical protein
MEKGVNDNSFGNERGQEPGKEKVLATISNLGREFLGWKPASPIDSFPSNGLYPFPQIFREIGNEKTIEKKTFPVNPPFSPTPFHT